jgi:peptidoglycan hydrolase-like protein with peptidoglycan-binding domain
MSILKRGLTGAPVKRLQEKLGIAADGAFGPGTEKAVRAFQEQNGLVVDGIAGPDTFTAMGLQELVLLRVGSRGAAVKSLQEDLGIVADGIFGEGTKAALMAFQTAQGLAADGMAGPTTLSRMNSFAATINEATVKKAEVQEDEQHFESEPLPELKGTEPVQSAEATAAPDKSLWGKVKGWFS